MILIIQQYVNKVIETKRMNIFIMMVMYSFCILFSYGCCDKDKPVFSKKNCDQTKQSHMAIVSGKNITIDSKVQHAKKNDISIGNTNEIEQLLKAFKPIINQVSGAEQNL